MKHAQQFLRSAVALVVALFLNPHLVLVALAVALVIPLQVLAAQPPAPVDPGGGGLGTVVLRLLQNEQVLALLIGGAVVLARVIWKDRADAHLSTVTWAIGLAYHNVNEIKLRFPSVHLDKANEALRVFKEALASQGITPRPQDLQRAQLAWKAMHGQEKLAAKLTTPAVAAVPTTPPAE